MEPILSINGCKCTQACPFFSRSSLKKEPLHHWLLWKGEQQLWAHCGSTNPSLIWTTSILLPAPTLHSVLSFSLLPSPQFSPPPRPSSFQPCPPLLPPAPPRCCLKSILSLFLPLDKTERVQGVIRQSSRGGMALVRLLSLAHKHTVRHRATEVRPLEGCGGHFCLCVMCWGRHFMCSRWEGWTTRPPTFFSAPTNGAWYPLCLISRNVSF